MILDRLDRSFRYLALHPDFAAAFRWVADPANAAAPCGRHELRGDDFAVIVEEGTTRVRSERRLEAHRRNIDIQVVMSGGEIMDWSPLAGLREVEAVPASDLWFYADPPAGMLPLTVPPASFTVFFPDDAHRPGIHLPGGPAPYRKLVFKLRADLAR
jgi:YhcH/YjgK/YiaL family protein